MVGTLLRPNVHNDDDNLNSNDETVSLATEGVQKWRIKPRWDYTAQSVEPMLTMPMRCSDTSTRVIG